MEEKSIWFFSLIGSDRTYRVHQRKEVEVNPQLLSIRQFSDATGVSAPTLYRKTATGQIPSAKVAGQVRIPVWYLDELTSRPGQLPNWIRGGNADV